MGPINPTIETTCSGTSITTSYIGHRPSGGKLMTYIAGEGDGYVPGGWFEHELERLDAFAEAAKVHAQRVREWEYVADKVEQP